jgi:hypothetical protein
MMYTLTLTTENIDTIGFVGNRYAWSDALKTMEVGANEIAEHEAWDIKESFESDTEGGHSFFPMLDHQSDLAEKLFTFLDAIV